MGSPGDPSISVLCVDDEPESAGLIEASLERFDDELSVTAVTSVAEGIEVLAESTVDCIVSEYDMPGWDGLAFLDAVRSDHPKLPFILFTRRGSNAIASDAISAGVTDYREKDGTIGQYRVLAHRIANAVDGHRLAQRATSATNQTNNTEAILDASPNAILVAVGGECRYTNPAGVELLTGGPDTEASPGSKDEITGRSITEFFHADDLPDVIERADSVAHVFDDKELCLRTTTGDEIPIEATARQITWGEDDAVLYSFEAISDRTAYEAEIEYQQSILDSTFEASPDGILVTTDERELVSYNDRFAELWDFPRDVLESGDLELARETACDRVEDTEAFLEIVRAQYETNEPQYTGIHLTDGTILQQYAAPLTLDGNGNETGTAGHVWFYRDVTELRNLERAQKEAYARMTDAVYSVTPDWEVTFVNDQAGTLLEWDPAELRGMVIWDAFPEAVDTEIYDRLTTAMDTAQPISFETEYEPLGIHLEIRAFPSNTGMTVYLRDITEERNTKIALRESVAALHRLYEITSAPDMTFDEKRQEILSLGVDYLSVADGFVTEAANSTQTIVAAAGETLSYTGTAPPPEESSSGATTATDFEPVEIGNAVADSWASDPVTDRSQSRSYIGGQILVDEALFGTVCFASSGRRPDAFTDVERTFVELLSRWLSYEQERQIHRTELENKNAQLEEFASIVSHDLRNPLTVASGRLALALETTDDENLRLVEQAHTRMRELIADILMLAKDGDVIDTITAVDLASVSDRCWETVETGSAALEITSSGAIAADERRLSQVLENLIRNAVEHGGSDVTVRIGDLEDGFYLEDDGAGIPAADRDVLFDSGFTTKTSGTGIGLRIVEKIVDAHGWTIDVTTGRDGGARFEITGVERVRDDSTPPVRNS